MTNLRIPGPIPVPQDILDKMSTQMMNHRGPRFKEMLYRVTDGLQQVFRTKNDVFVLTSSGTGAMEAAVVNTLSPGEKVVCASIGFIRRPLRQDRRKFRRRGEDGEVPSRHCCGGRRVATRPRRRSGDIRRPRHPQMRPTPASPTTSSGWPRSSRTSSTSFCSSTELAACAPCLWRQTTGTSTSWPRPRRKGWMLPPGLAFISMSKRAWEAHENATMPRFYFDLSAYKSYFRTWASRPGRPTSLPCTPSTTRSRRSSTRASRTSGSATPTSRR